MFGKPIGSWFSVLDMCLEGNLEFLKSIGSRKEYAAMVRARVFDGDSAAPHTQPLLIKAIDRMKARGASFNDVCVVLGYILADTVYFPGAENRIYFFLLVKSGVSASYWGSDLALDLLSLVPESPWNRVISSIRISPSVLERVGAANTHDLYRIFVQQRANKFSREQALALNQFSRASFIAPGQDESMESGSDETKESILRELREILADCSGRLESPSGVFLVLLVYIRETVLAQKVDGEIISHLPPDMLQVTDSDYSKLVDDLCAVVQHACAATDERPAHLTVYTHLTVNACTRGVPELTREYGVRVIKELHMGARVVNATEMLPTKQGEVTNCLLMNGVLSTDETRPVEARHHGPSIKTWACMVDRSMYIPFFLSKGSLFIARPPGFGKSLWLSLLKAFFSDPKSLSSAFAMNELSFKLGSLVHAPQASQYFPPRPVLYFDFSLGLEEKTDRLGKALSQEPDHLLSYLHSAIDQLGRVYGVNCSAGCRTWDAKLDVLIRESARSSGQRIVILVDEYDAFLRGYEFFCPENEDTWAINEEAQAIEEVRDIMTRFFAVFNRLRHLILLRVTMGVTKGQLPEVFLDADGFSDVTFDPVVSRLFGFTDEEVSRILAAHALTELHEQVREWCGGYSFDAVSPGLKVEKVYNPYYIQQVVSQRAVGDYWLQPESAPEPSETRSGVVGRYLKIVRYAKLPLQIYVNRLYLAERNPSGYIRSFSAAFLVYWGYATVCEVEDLPIRSVDALKYGEARVVINAVNARIGRRLAEEFLSENVRKFGTDGHFARILAFLSSGVPDWQGFGVALASFMHGPHYIFNPEHRDFSTPTTPRSRSYHTQREENHALSDENGVAPNGCSSSQNGCSSYVPYAQELADEIWHEERICAFLRAAKCQDVLVEGSKVSTSPLASRSVSFKAGSNYICVQLKWTRGRGSSDGVGIDGLVELWRNKNCAAQCAAGCTSHVGGFTCQALDFTCHAVACVLWSVAPRPCELRLEDGRTIWISPTFGEEQRTNGPFCTLMLCPTNEFYMRMFYARVGFYARLCTCPQDPLEAKVRSWFLANHFICLSLINLQASDFGHSSTHSSTAMHDFTSIHDFTSGEVERIVQASIIDQRSMETLLKCRGERDRTKSPACLSDFVRLYKDFRYSLPPGDAEAATQELDQFAQDLDEKEKRGPEEDCASLKPTKRKASYPFKLGLDLAVRNVKQMMCDFVSKKQNHLRKV